MRLLQLHLTNFLSYRDATLELGDLVALVGPNASGKSNAVAAIKLLRDIPLFTLQTALTRRGGFDQLRHRSGGRPFDPAVALEFQLPGGEGVSTYELHLGSKAGRRYEVKLERGLVKAPYGTFEFSHQRGKIEMSADDGVDAPRRELPQDYVVPEGQSALPVILGYGFYEIWDALSNFQIVEINPAKVREFQDPTPGYELIPDGSNTASVFEDLQPIRRHELINELSAIVPGLTKIELRRVSNKLTVNFGQEAGDRTREFLAHQMSDGTLRAFGITLALLQPRRPYLIVIEEPEVAIHLGALRTLVDILRQHSSEMQILLTTHSADIIDALVMDEVRVVWSEDGISHIGRVADHTKETIRKGMVTPGELLRSDALDPAAA